MGRKTSLLPQVSFSILLALSLKPRYGYELMQQIEHDSGKRLQLGPGALYGAMKQLREANHIEEMPSASNDRRRYYRLTRKGWTILETEIQYYQHIAKLADERHLLPPS